MIRVANAPCSWGVLEFESTAAPASYSTVLDEIRDSGYSGTELGDWGFMPTDPAQLRRELDERRLSLIGAFVPVALANQSTHEAGAATAIRTAALMRDAGAQNAFIVLSDDNGSVPERERHAGRITRNTASPKSGGRRLPTARNHIARAVKNETGLRTVFHPIAADTSKRPIEIDALMSRTDPALVGMVLDTGHIIYGGGDPVRVFEAHADRVWHVHFKDCDLRVADEARAQRAGLPRRGARAVVLRAGRGRRRSSPRSPAHSAAPATTAGSSSSRMSSLGTARRKPARRRVETTCASWA
jgi:inosose dehydratase